MTHGMPPPPCVRMDPCFLGGYHATVETVGFFGYSNSDGTPYRTSKRAVKRLGVRVTLVLADDLHHTFVQGLPSVQTPHATLYYTKICLDSLHCKYRWAWDSKSPRTACAVILSDFAIDAISHTARARAEKNIWFESVAGDRIKIATLEETPNARPEEYRRMQHSDPPEPRCPKP